MTPEIFVNTLRNDALVHREKLSPVATLAQAAWESGWGEHAPGNMYFGVKDTDGINGNEQLIKTIEYSKRADLKFPEIISVTPVVINGNRFFKYVIKDYFRRYPNPSACFNDHIDFFYKNTRYVEAIKFKDDPDRFFEEIAKAGYATDPKYAANLKAISNTIKKFL